MTNFRTQLSNGQWFLIILVCFIFSLKFGLNFAVSNQNHYLLPALKALDPSLFPRDWVVNSSTPHHIVYSVIAQFLLILSPAGWTFAMANVLTCALVGLLIFFIIRELVDIKFLIPTFLIVITVCTLTQTKSAGTTYICTNIFQPASLGALGFLAGLFFFLKERYFISGICLAIGGINHANYLVLSFPVFGLAHLLLGKKQLLNRLAAQFVLPALAVVPFLPMMLEMANSADADFANRIYVDIRNPHHHNPNWFWPRLLIFGAGVAFCVVLGWKQLSKNATYDRFRALFIAMLTGTVLGVLLTTVIFSYTVARFMPWRTNPFIMLFASIIATVGIIKILHKENVVYRLVSTPFAQFVKKHLFMLSLLFWVSGSVATFVTLKANSNLLLGQGKSEKELYAWCSTTSKDALFCIPPMMEDFRIQARRSVVIDWKPSPSTPSEGVEWYHRLETISGVEGFTHQQQVTDGYNNMSNERLRMLCEKYGINYVVLRRDWQKQPVDAPTIFENKIYRVIKADVCSDTSAIH